MFACQNTTVLVVLLILIFVESRSIPACIWVYGRMSRGERRERGGDLNEDEFPARERVRVDGKDREGKKGKRASSSSSSKTTKTIYPRRNISFFISFPWVPHDDTCKKGVFLTQRARREIILLGKSHQEFDNLPAQTTKKKKLTLERFRFGNSPAVFYSSLSVLVGGGWHFLGNGREVGRRNRRGWLGLDG